MVYCSKHRKMCSEDHNAKTHAQQNPLRSVLSTYFQSIGRDDLASIVQGNSKGTEKQYEEIAEARKAPAQPGTGDGMNRISVNLGRDGGRNRITISAALKRFADAKALRSALALDDTFIVTGTSGTSANGTSHQYVKLQRDSSTRAEFKRVCEAVEAAYPGQLVKSFTGTKTPVKVFVGSDENLRAILDSPERSGTGRSGKRGPLLSKPNQEEKKLQRFARRYAEGKGIRVVQWDTGGYPDHQFQIGRQVLDQAEYKVKGRRPDRIQAQRILELRGEGFKVPVIGTKKDAKSFIDSLIQPGV